MQPKQLRWELLESDDIEDLYYEKLKSAVARKSKTETVPTQVFNIALVGKRLPRMSRKTCNFEGLKSVEISSGDENLSGERKSTSLTRVKHFFFKLIFLFWLRVYTFRFWNLVNGCWPFRQQIDSLVNYIAVKSLIATLWKVIVEVYKVR